MLQRKAIGSTRGARSCLRVFSTWSLSEYYSECHSVHLNNGGIHLERVMSVLRNSVTVILSCNFFFCTSFFHTENCIRVRMVL